MICDEASNRSGGAASERRAQRSLPTLEAISGFGSLTIGRADGPPTLQRSYGETLRGGCRGGGVKGSVRAIKDSGVVSGRLSAISSRAVRWVGISAFSAFSPISLISFRSRRTNHPFAGFRGRILQARDATVFAVTRWVSALSLISLRNSRRGRARGAAGRQGSHSGGMASMDAARVQSWRSGRPPLPVTCRRGASLADGALRTTFCCSFCRSAERDRTDRGGRPSIGSAGCWGGRKFPLFVIRSARRAPGPNHPYAALRGHIPQKRDVTISALRAASAFSLLNAFTFFDSQNRRVGTPCRGQ